MPKVQSRKFPAGFTAAHISKQKARHIVPINSIITAMMCVTSLLIINPPTAYLHGLIGSLFRIRIKRWSFRLRHVDLRENQ